MDSLRGPFESGTPADDAPDWGVENDVREDVVRELPPEAIGQDERRMQVRAYNHWASLLGEATFPSIELLEPENLTDFGPNSVLLDFSRGIEDPAVQFLGDKLARECGTQSSSIMKLSDVPPRSLLSRITDHYMQILANQAPIGFEAEFVNDRGASVLYRGILLPFSSDDETIDFIFGVINWKEMADAATADELLLAIDQAIDEKLAAGTPEDEEEDHPQKHITGPLTEWADSPAHEGNVEPAPVFEAGDADLWAEDEEAQELSGAALNDFSSDSSNIANFADLTGDSSATPGSDLPEPDFGAPDFGHFQLDDPDLDVFGEEIDEDEEDEEGADYSFASLADYLEAPSKKAVDLDAERFDPEDYKPENYEAEERDEARGAEGDAEGDIGGDGAPQVDEHEDAKAAKDSGDARLWDETPADDAPTDEAPTDEAQAPLAFDPDATLHDCLASARDLAQSARVSEDRTRHALYAAVGRAYDVSLAAQDEPEAFNELIEDNGLSVQERAPMTPVVKLVFGQAYDKTRLTEYATVLNHAHRLELARGSLGEFLANADGGLKSIVAAERRMRREEAGEVVETQGDVRAKLAEKLRELDALMFDCLSREGPEFSLVMVRRDGEGNVAMIGEIDDDLAMIERAGKKLVG